MTKSTTTPKPTTPAKKLTPPAINSGKGTNNSSTAPKKPVTSIAPWKPAHAVDAYITKDGIELPANAIYSEEKVLAKLGEVGLALCTDILAYCRVTKHEHQDTWIKDHLKPMIEAANKITKGHMSEDDYGNLFVEIGETNILFTAHTDTVHAKSSPYTQKVAFNVQKRLLFKDDGNCLGADDGTGVFILLKMIEANVPGTYAFYKNEECGRLGSQYDHDNGLKLTAAGLSPYDQVVSFDRKGATDIITRQMSGKCASDTYAKALAKAMKDVNGIDYKPSPNGSFTDSATFMDSTPECTNIAVGYMNQHGREESQNLQVLESLIAAVTTIDWGALPIDRDPFAVEPVRPFGGYGGYSDYYGYQPSLSAIDHTEEDFDDGWELDDFVGTRRPNALREDDKKRRIEDLEQFLVDYPTVAAYILNEQYDIDADILYQAIFTKAESIQKRL